MTPVKRPKPRRPLAPHPWRDFLEARMRALVWMRDVMGYVPEESARQLSMDPGQVRLILATADDNARRSLSQGSAKGR